MLKRVFVMGATGRMGGAIVARLATRGVQVRAAVRDAERAVGGSGVESVRFDLAEPETWAEAVADCASMFVMWPPGTSTAQVMAFVEVAQRCGVTRVAFLSVLGAEQMSFLPHRKIEVGLLQSSLSSVLLRSGYFMQNFSTMHRDDVRLRDEVSLPTGGGRISMVDVWDVADAAVVGLLSQGGSVAWNLTGPAALNTAEAAATLSEVLGRPIRDRAPGPVRFYRDQRKYGVDRGLAMFMVAEYSHARLGLAARLGDGVQLALGREPVSFREFALRERDAWVASPVVPSA